MAHKTKLMKLKIDDQQWWSKGIKFECQGSGKCCTSRGGYGFVYLTLTDRKRFAKFFKIRTAEFTKKFCTKSHGLWHLNEDKENPDCMFLIKNRCSVYEARPTQCRTWPFWPEVMNPKAWVKEVINYCPGVGKGKNVSAQEIKKTLLEQIKSEKEL